MDMTFFAGLVALAALLVAGLALWWSGRARQDGGTQAGLAALAAAQQELAGRIGQLAESQTAAQGQLARGLDERVAALSRQVAETLEGSSRRTAGSIGEIASRLTVIDEAQRNIANLTGQVVSLQDLLANKQARGAFGEIQLQDLVTAALPPSLYEFQATLSNGKRVDCLLRLPAPPGVIGVDAKFPLESYHALRRAQGDQDLAAARRAFAAAVSHHVREIAEKYILPGETADSALMFLPSEAVYAELHAALPEVVEKSFRARVWIVSPTTLMATLNTVRAILKDARLREQAGVIQGEVRKLIEDVRRLDDRIGKLQRHFQQAADDIQQAKTSSDKILRRGERIDALEMDPDQPPALAAPDPAED